MQRLINDSLGLIATHTEDFRVACVGFYVWFIQLMLVTLICIGFVQSRDVFQEKALPRQRYLTDLGAG